MYIVNAASFFELFDSAASPKHTAAALFVKASPHKTVRRRPNDVQRIDVVEAAFHLLQWAEYGDVSEFPKPDHSKGIEKSEDIFEKDEESDEVMNEQTEEEYFEEGEENKAEWAEHVVDAASAQSNLPEVSDPNGLQNGITLHAYQRQALHWMMKRERNSEDRSDLEAELQLLAELSPQDKQTKVTNHNPEPQSEISCECGPIIVNKDGARKSMTLAGELDPVDHPLWKRRFLATRGMEAAISFYVCCDCQVFSRMMSVSHVLCTGQ